MLDRRTILGGGAMLGLLAACGGPAGPGTVSVAATGSAGMNPGPDGSDRPVTLTLVQLRGTGAFDAADVFALQDPATALGGDLAGTAQIALAPGGSGSAAITLDPSTTHIGIIAGFRDPAGKVFRLKAPVAQGKAQALAVTVGAGGLSLG
jgi:type VI secretion system protein VasD